MVPLMPGEGEPKLGEPAGRLELRPGDTIVVCCPEHFHITAKTMDCIKTVIEHEFPGHKCFVLGEGMRLGVMGADPANGPDRSASVEEHATAALVGAVLTEAHECGAIGDPLKYRADENPGNKVLCAVRDIRATLQAAAEFLRRAGEEGRIVSSSDLTELQIIDAQRERRFYVDPVTSYGWALLPWDLTTRKDSERNARRQRI